MGDTITFNRRVRRLRCAVIAAAVTAALLYFETRRDFGSSPLSQPTRNEVAHTQTLRVLSHPHVAIIRQEGAVRIIPLSDWPSGPDDPAVIGSVDLAAWWASPIDGPWPAVTINRRLGICITGAEHLDADELAAVTHDFLRLLESWGHGQLVSTIRAGGGDAVLPRWPGIWAHARGWTVLVAFLAALGASIILALQVAGMMWRRWLTTAGLRDRRLERGVCPTCAYPRTGLTGDICPECGERSTTRE